MNTKLVRIPRMYIQVNITSAGKIYGSFEYILFTHQPKIVCRIIHFSTSVSALGK